MRKQRKDFRDQGVTKSPGEVSRESREKFQEPEKHKTPGEVSRESREKPSGTRETQNPLGEVSREIREKFQEIFNIRKRVTVNALYQ
jgi:hypothetical protein